MNKTLYTELLLLCTCLCFTWSKVSGAPVDTSSITLLDAKAKQFAAMSLSDVGGTSEQIPIGISPERSWWNLVHYNIRLKPNYANKSISGSNELSFAALKDGIVMQIDLKAPMRISAVKWKGRPLAFERRGDAYLVSFPKLVKKGERRTILLEFDGQPPVSLNAPFENGWIWAKDDRGRPWMSVACQGKGASIWLPCKELLYDKPDRGIDFYLTVPDTLTAVAGGRLKERKDNKDGTATFHWRVSSPINNYNIIPYIGKYVSWEKPHYGLKGRLDCTYWVLDYNLSKGKQHLAQADTMLRTFEYWMGAYPFYGDGYKLVEAPMHGMEHQGAIAYGNGFQNGYRGKDLISGTGWGLKWDFILVHESAHEWFGNSITSSSNGDTWLHEGFAKYLETLYTDKVFGTAAGNEYTLGTWKRIKNNLPVLGTSTQDRYYKGAALLHMVRQLTGNAIFRDWLHGLNEQFAHRTITTAQVLAYLNKLTKRNFSKMFEQYLKTVQVPELEYCFLEGKLYVRWNNCINNFDMPLNIAADGKNFNRVYPTTAWQPVKMIGVAAKNLTVDRNYYINTRELRSINE
ncbi:M1 family metallopeptidase [Pedobacter helvus]|uniref:M1 family metallopeptidase n=1 Tax=Pedobacter helvus TaxID=2563444 RepID=A0ABW9JD99_9SPHI|nr:M1 family metallopeptidase [Pedobacter ureilyticus]